MSFSSEVKEELSRHLPTARHCQIAETAAILSLCGQISEKDGTDSDRECVCGKKVLYFIEKNI